MLFLWAQHTSLSMFLQVDFSDSEEVDSVYDEESDVASDEGRSVPKGAVAQLLSLKRVWFRVYYRRASATF